MAIRLFLALAGVVIPACFYNPTGSVPGSTSEGGDSSSSGSSAHASATGDPTGATTLDTTGPSTACGDGLVDAGEQCDDGDQDDTNACTNACTVARCGDGVVGPGEACDDGDQEDNDACNNVCVLPTCGDGIVQLGEDCDTSGESVACNANCTTPACGDQFVNPSAGEECDPGAETDLCDLDCTLPVCGDGVHNPSAGEGCDDGNAAAGDRCSASCASTVIVDVAAGKNHLCVAFETGVVRCWGRGFAGALGQGDADDLGGKPGEVPVPDLEVGGKVVQLSSGDQYTCTRLDTGAARCWGENSFGNLGYGNLDSLGDNAGELPPLDVGLGASALQIQSGGQHTCAILTGGALRCWGRAYTGQLGYWMYKDAGLVQPVDVDVPGLTDVKALALGYHHSCALQADGKVRCWGNNGAGELGLGHTINVGEGEGQMPPPTLELGGVIIDISAGFNHTCAVREDGKVLCWGSGTRGKLGTGSATNVGDQPGQLATAVDLGGDAVQVVTGYEHTCARLTTGKVKCWGYGVFGRLGYGNTNAIDTADEFPPPDLELGGDAILLASHLGDFTCALLADHTLRCWGNNSSGQLGHGHTDAIGDDETPASAGPVPF